MIEYKFDTQLLIEGTGLDEDVIYDYFVEHFKGDCLLVVGDDELIKIHYHTMQPGRCWNTAPRWVRSTTLFWKTCSCSPMVCTADSL